MEWYWLVAIIVVSYVLFALIQAVLCYVVFDNPKSLWDMYWFFFKHQIWLLLGMGLFIGVSENSSNKVVDKLKLEIDNLKKKIEAPKNENAS